MERKGVWFFERVDLFFLIVKLRKKKGIQFVELAVYRYCLIIWKISVLFINIIYLCLWV